MKRLSGGYTWYFNKKHNRSGSLFQGRFKVKHIDSQEYLEYISAYINANDKIHQKISGSSREYLFSSYPSYINEGEGGIKINKNIILKNFKDINEYRGFVKDVIKNSGERKDDIKKYYLE